MDLLLSSVAYSFKNNKAHNKYSGFVQLGCKLLAEKDYQIIEHIFAVVPNNPRNRLSPIPMCPLRLCFVIS